jgi:GTPase involved in cell partitioning and DNA repair
MFIDEVEIYVRGGDGGTGCASFTARNTALWVGRTGRRGRGGSVILRAPRA